MNFNMSDAIKNLFGSRAESAASESAVTMLGAELLGAVGGAGRASTRPQPQPPKGNPSPRM